MLNICLPSDEYVCQVVEGKGEVQCQQSCQGEQTKHSIGEVQCQQSCQRQQTKQSRWGTKSANYLAEYKVPCNCTSWPWPHRLYYNCTSLPYQTDCTVPPDPTWRYLLTLPKKLYWTVTLDRTWQTVLYILTLHGRLYLLTLPTTLYCTCHLFAVKFLYMTDRCVLIDLTVLDKANFIS